MKSAIRRKSRSSNQSRAGTRESGAVALELALLAPILLIIVFGIINFGVIFAQKLALNNAVREGARAEVVGAAQYSTVNIEGKVRTALGGTIAMNPADVDITGGSCADSAGAGEDLTVTAYYEADLLMPIFIFPETIGLDGTAVYRCEW